MKKPAYLLVIIILFFSCNHNSKTPKKEKSTIDLTQTDKEEKIVEPKEELILPRWREAVSRAYLKRIS